MYGPDLAYIHHAAFLELATGAGFAIVDRLRRSGLGQGLAVDLACGSGVLASTLVRAGFDVLGIDRSGLATTGISRSMWRRNPSEAC